MIKLEWVKTLEKSMGGSYHTLWEDERYEVYNEEVITLEVVDICYGFIKERNEYQSEVELIKEIERRIAKVAFYSNMS